MTTLGERILARVFAARQATNHWQAGHPVLRAEEESGGVRVAVEFVDVDRIGLRLRRLHAERITPFVDAAYDPDRLRRQAEEIARRVSYLTERLGLIEFDAHHGRAQLRSTPPRRDTAHHSFYEIILTRNHQVAFCRYESADKDVPSPRAVVAFEITHDMFSRLVNDLAATLTVS